MLTETSYIETELLSRITEGDEAAFTVLFRRYNNRIYSIAFKLTGSTAIAEEIVQDVFLKIWQRRAGLMNINDFRAYLFIVTRNHIYKELKKNASNYKTTILAIDNQQLVHNNTEDSVTEKEYNQLLKKAIDRLPVQQQKVYLLMKEQGFKREEVAGFLKIHPETIKSHLAQAMRNIRSYCLLHSDIHLGIIMCLFAYFQNF